MVRGERGILFVVSAPSGAGKTTLVRKVISQLPRVSLSVSCTTRAPRPGEQEGVDYFFITRDEFSAMEREGKFIEWAHVHGDLYGTPRANLERLQHGEDLVLEIDTQGARKIRETFSEGVLIFILPPSLKVLGERIKARGGDSEEAIQARLQNAHKELDQKAWYDYIVVNTEIEEATRELASIIIAERCKTARILAGGRGGIYGTDNG
ncbi:MAG: guanylate kinase [Deltaproteobacteria bacterium RBG_13_52_11]|nr:MAG: guanylate kinase [Deltaproteobacteria bacterium RBG_13_52_11]